MNIHFIAIGGSAMHNLAIALYNKGYNVTGSDDTIHDPSKSRLEKRGLLPNQFGWFPEKITSNLDVIILGMHAKKDNPELLKAQELGLKIYSYPEFLFEQSKDKTRVVIGGSHGKTTITSMILHVLNYHDKHVDYMVGAQLDGFETMVHLYKPNIALLSGIAWDHINVFPTFENYLEQFQIFTDSLTNGGIMVYNEEDVNVKQVVENSEHPIKKYPYSIPQHFVDNGTTYIDTPDGDMPLEIFGDHNLQNLAGAKWICQHMGIDEDDFYEAIASFKGASKRLEKVAESGNAVIFKDFAHSPSKVKATTEAVKKQYKQREVMACLELHTYSSLNAEFLKEYKGALDTADTAVVFYSPHAVQIKQLEEVTAKQIGQAFEREDLIIYTNPEEFQTYLFSQNLENKALLLMSSGNYGGLDSEELKKLI